MPDDGTHEICNDLDVWVYPGNEAGKELVIDADHDAPRLLTITDGEHAASFRDWGTTETPQRTEQSEIISEDEFQQRVEQAIG